MSKSISNGLSVDIPVQATHSLKLAWLGGTYTAQIISGAANVPVALATNSASDQTFGPYATAIMVRLTVSAIGRVAWDTASAPAFIPPGEQFTRQDDGIPVTLSGVGPAAAFAVDGAGNSSPFAPGAPTIGTATVSGSTVTLPFTAPGNVGASAILDYQALLVDGTTVTVSASPAPFPLKAAGAYVGAVRARNVSGYGPYSAQSNAVTVAGGGGGTVNMFVFAGQSQSNSNGTTGNDVPGSVSGVMPTIYTWDPINSVFVNYQAGTGGTSALHLKTGSIFTDPVDYWGAEAKFCKQWAVDHPSEPLYIVKSGFSSTSLDTRARATDRGCWDPTLPADLYAFTRNAIVAAKAALVAQGKTVNMRGMGWIQGENDADNATTAAAYDTNLRAFIDACRTDFLGSSAPFVISRIQTAGWTNPGPVRTAQVSVGTTKENCRWVDADNLTIAADGIHYNPTGVVSLGDRIYAAANTSADIVAAYVAKMTVAPSAPRQALMATMFDTLLASSAWPTLVAVELLASHDAQSSTVNAATPAITGVNSAMTFTVDRGYTGVSTASYFNSGVVPLSADSRMGRTAAHSFYSPSDVDTAGVDMGNADGSAAVSVSIVKTASFNFRINNSTNDANNLVAQAANAAGLWTLNRDGVQSAKLYQNGVQYGATDATHAAASFASNLAVYVGNRNGGTNGTTKRYAAYLAGGPRTAAQEASIASALTTYLTAIGAN